MCPRSLGYSHNCLKIQSAERLLAARHLDGGAQSDKGLVHAWQRGQGLEIHPMLGELGVLKWQFPAAQAVDRRDSVIG